MTQQVEKTLVCDKCGYSQRYAVDTKYTDTGFHELKIHPVAGGTVTTFGDLCPTCLKSLYSWFNLKAVV